MSSTIEVRVFQENKLIFFIITIINAFVYKFDYFYLMNYIISKQTENPIRICSDMKQRSMEAVFILYIKS